MAVQRNARGLWCLLLVILPLLNNVLSARILGFFPSNFKSHQIIHCTIANTLAKAGHDVTVLGGTSNVVRNSLYRHIRIDGIGIGGAGDVNFTNYMVNQREPIYKKMQTVINDVMRSSNESMSSPVMKQFLQDHDEGSFDLLIVGYFMNDFHLGLGGHFKCPIIISLMAQPISPVNVFIGNPNEIAYVPTVFSGLTQPMDFLGRVKNLISDTLDRYGLVKIISNQNADLYKQHFPAPHYPSFEEVAKNVSLVFSNHHSVSQGPIRPNVPALIEIGGIQIKERPDPLPQHIEKILNSANEGLIYFSFGSSVQGSALAADKAKAMFTVLSKLPYKVLWKWDDLNFPGESANIFYENWLPQDDILAHPNVMLFITHGGHGSVVESQYHGVPMVAIPLYGDQYSNAAKMVESGFGVTLAYETLDENSFREALQEVLGNVTYRTTVKKFSRLYRDRPMAPSEMVLYWTEYVLRYSGARHMKSPAIFLNEFQLLSLDVILFLAGAVGLFIAFCCCSIKFLGFLCGCKNSKEKNFQQMKTKKNK